MIKLLTAYSREADDPQKAVREIQEQLNLEERQLAHSAALVFCHNEFIESGVMRAVSKSLSCLSAGCSCQFFAVSGAADEMLLTVAVLTSDDVAFAAGISGPLDPENLDERIGDLYRETAAALGADPSLVFALQPTMLNLSGDMIAAAVDRSCGGVPVFGT